jgi:spermidine synthase
MIRLKTFLPFIIMGFTSLLLQITVLRLLLSTFSGNELDIGITLSFWLIYAGLGSFIGRKIKFKHAFAVSFVLLALLSQPTALAIKAIRPVLSLEPGETVSLAATILSTAVTLFPLCFIIGLQFPLAVSYSGSRDAAAKVYGLEALGAFIGGIGFTFIISSHMSALDLCLSLSCLNILFAAYVSKSKTMAFLFVIPMIFYFGVHGIMSTLPWHGGEVYRTAESRYGEIAVIKVGGQSSIYAGGHLLYSSPDLQSEEMRTHLPMTLHPFPQKILVIGGSPGILKEFLKYPVEKVDFIELDPKIIEVSREILSADDDKNALKDRRVRIIIEDGRRFIKGLEKPAYDVIVLNLPQPSTADINRFYTSEFFQEAKKALKTDGVLAISISQSTGYIGRRMKMANGSIYNSLKYIFGHVEVTAQEYGSLFASETAIDINPVILEERFVQRAITTKYFNQYLFRDAFSPMNVEYVRQRLDEITFANTDLQPSAYLYNLILWTEVHGGKALQSLIGVRKSDIFVIISVMLVFVSILIFRKKNPVIYFSVFSTGFSGMSFMLSGILVYQALYGHVYEMIGILSAAFMIGIWIGTVLIKYAQRAAKDLFYLELITFSLALAAPFFFKTEFLFHILILLAGTVTGGLFTAANAWRGDAGAAGSLYGMDLAGSFLGAFIPSVVIIPLFGAAQALFLVAFIKVFSAVMVLSYIKAPGNYLEKNN